MSLKSVVLDGNPMKSIRRDIIMVSYIFCIAPFVRVLHVDAVSKRISSNYSNCYCDIKSPVCLFLARHAGIEEISAQSYGGT